METWYSSEIEKSYLQTLKPFNVCKNKLKLYQNAYERNRNQPKSTKKTATAQMKSNVQTWTITLAMYKRNGIKLLKCETECSDKKRSITFENTFWNDSDESRKKKK